MPDEVAMQTLAIVQQFHDALNQHNVELMMSFMTENCLFENTSPAPDGTIYRGQAAVRAFWEQFFADAPFARIDIEEIFVAGEKKDRCVLRWTYYWRDPNESGSGPNHVRGVDVFKVEGGKISVKLSYVKG
jgi:hypothetical protein